MEKDTDGCVLCIARICRFEPLSQTHNGIHLLLDICSIFGVTLLIRCKFIHSLTISEVSPGMITLSPPWDGYPAVGGSAAISIQAVTPHFLWCIHPCASAPAAPAPVWKESFCTRRRSASACNMAHWHQPRCLDWFSCCMWWQSVFWQACIFTKKKEALIIRVAFRCWS